MYFFIILFSLGGGEVGRLKSTFWRWALIRGWALNQINMVYVVIACLKKICRYFTIEAENNHRDLQTILKLLFSREHEQRD